MYSNLCTETILFLWTNYIAVHGSLKLKLYKGEEYCSNHLLDGTLLIKGYQYYQCNGKKK